MASHSARHRPAGPLLAGALAWVDCTFHAEYDGGDHTIVVANVLDLDAAPEGEPLLFFRGDYRV